MLWQERAADGKQAFRDARAVSARIRELDRAFDGLCIEIGKAVRKQAGQRSSKSGDGLARARALRAKPAAGGKSLYECLNQLIHYWYCCAAARHLCHNGYTDLVVRPTAVDSGGGNDKAYDLSAVSPEGTCVIGEVFCVSPSLFAAKLAKTYDKLDRNKSGARRLIFYNHDVGKQPSVKRRPQAYFLSIAQTGAVQLVNATDARPLTGIRTVERA